VWRGRPSLIITLRDFIARPFCASYASFSDPFGAHLPAGVDACNVMIG
jgi:hypothetical protein